LGSLALDPGNHPVREDWRVGLGVRGAWAARTARLPAARRLLLAAWFLAAGFLPRRMAASAIAWRMVPDTRPAIVGRATRRLRSLLRGDGVYSK
jgi:hypothetical protein